MGRTRAILISLLVSVGVAIGVASITQAQWSSNLQSSDRVTVASGEVHEGSLYAAGDQIMIEGTVEGDLYCAGRELVIKGEVTGDVLCAVQSATLDGTVGQDIRLAGQYAHVNGEVSGSMTFFGQDLKVNDDGSIGGDLNGAAQFVTLGGPLGRDLLIGVQKLTLESTVGGDVNAAVDQVVTGGGARVTGDFNYSADREVAINESLVEGSVHFNQADHNAGKAGLAWGVMVVTSLMLTSLIIILLAPRFVERSQVIASENPLTTGLIGFATLFGAPIVAVMLMVSVVLFPLGLLVFAFWFAAILVSQALFAYLLGSLFWRQQNNMFVRALAGVIVLFALYLIPGINVLTGFISLVGGIGMAVTTLLHGYKRPKYTLAPEPTKPKPKSKKS